MADERGRHDSFVLRIWWEKDDCCFPVWRGRIQHAATGETACMTAVEDLLAFIEARTGSLRKVEK